MARPAPLISLTSEQRTLLEGLARSRETAHSLVQRAQMVLQAADGEHNKHIAQALGLNEDSVGQWRRRWVEAHDTLAALAGQPKRLRAAIEEILSDRPRSGSPGDFTAEQICQIIALACETPPPPLTHWTRDDLVRETIARGIAETISASTIGRFLNQADLKPHRTRYWLNAKIADEATFRQEVRTVCKLYHQAQELHEQGVHVISTDEKTGIQALEPIHPSHPMRPDRPEAVEFEYERHGTQALIANFEVATGHVITPSIGDTRTEADFLAHIAATVDTDPQGEWIFVCDQLNTHQSASLVEFVAQRCEIKTELGCKEKEGILKSMASRAAFLQEPTHRIRFVYTPKHCSWLNQVEIWFGILTRRLLKRGRFASTDELKQRILEFIEFFNQTLAKPFRWTYIGKPLMA